jgi:uncharacterized protein (TIGR02271 family)
MLSGNDIQAITGAHIVANDGHKIVKAGQVYLDDETGQPEWVTANTGLFGKDESFVPLAQASLEGSTLRVPYTKDIVKGAPRVAAEGHLDPNEEQNLYRYYGLTAGSDTGHRDTASTETMIGTVGAGDRDGDGTGDDVQGRAVGHDTSGPTTDDAMTRSEERLNVGTERVQARRARLRKYVTTEQQTVTVPVSREEVRVEREPITDANRDAALSGPGISEEEHEVVLTEERPVVSKETVPVERVRLDKQTLTDQQQVSDEVRKEQIEVDGDTDSQQRRD